MLEAIRILNLRFIVYFVFALVLLGIGFMCGSFYQHIDKTQTISMMDATSEICSTNIEKQRLFALRRLTWTINDYKTTHTDLDTSFSDDFFVGMPKVRLAVDIVDGSGQVKPFTHQRFIMRS